jgi:hypothetical protein
MDAAAYAVLSVQSDELPPGEHCFGIYRWQKQGVKPDETLVAIATEPQIEAKLLTLLQTARPHDAPLPNRLNLMRWTGATSNVGARRRRTISTRIAGWWSIASTA